MSAVRRPPTLADVVNKMGRELMALDQSDRPSVLIALCALAKVYPTEGSCPESLSRALVSSVEAGHPNGLPEVQAFWLAEQLAGDPDAFFYFWERRGWRDKVGPIRSWRMAARGWARKDAGPQRVSNARREAYK